MISSGFKIFSDRRDAHKLIAETIVNILGEPPRYSMREAQKEVFNRYRNEDRMIVVQPPGAGKSMLTKFIAMDNLMSNENLKVVICVPQTIIAKTFRETNLLHEDGVYRWRIGHDLCDDLGESKTEYIKKFLLTKKFPKGDHERVLLCTHAAICDAWNELKQEGKTRGIFSNTMLFIDEAHHILNSSYEFNGEEYSYDNQLGSLVRAFLKIKSSKLWLLTATNFRGDRMSVLTEKEKAKFKSYHLPLDIYWEKYLRYVESYSFDFVTYQDCPIKNAVEILKNNKKKTIIYVKGGGQKYNFISELTKKIKKVWKGASILDLVTEEGREERKDHILNEDLAQNVDIVLAVDILNEGTDWPMAEQVIDLAPSNSLRILVQRFGRLIRDLEDKKHLNYFVFLPFCIQELLEPEDYRRHLNSVFTHFTASLLLEGMIAPLEMIPKVREGSGEGGDGKAARNPLLEAVDESKAAEILSAVVKELCFLKGSGDVTAEMAEKCIKDTLLSRGVEDNLDEIALHIIRTLRRKTLTLGENLDWMIDAGFEKVYSDSIFDSIEGFVSGVMGVKGFKEFRDIYERNTLLLSKNRLTEILMTLA